MEHQRDEVARLKQLHAVLSEGTEQLARVLLALEHGAPQEQLSGIIEDVYRILEYAETEVEDMVYAAALSAN